MLRALLLCALLALPAAAAPREDGMAPGEVPESLAVLSWGLAEIAVDLDLPLAGVADAEGYATWVGRPALPRGVVDLGLRAEPNLEALGELAPGLVLGSDEQADMEARLDAVAPTTVLDLFSAGHDNAAVARASYRRIAATFGKAALAERRLAEIEAALGAAGDRVRAAWGGQVPAVLPIRLLTPASLRIHGPNSMAAAALEAMGLAPAAGGPPTEWGFTLAPVDRLAEYPDAAIVHIDPFAEKAALFGSPLWRAIPAVAAGRFAVAEPAWTFGGVVSLEVLGARLAEALVAMGERR